MVSRLSGLNLSSCTVNKSRVMSEGFACVAQLWLLGQSFEWSCMYG